jgi:3-oxoacyl-[acyl-carrier protein] reductase
MMQLENEVVLVSGASRGIGKAIAEAMGAQGATVVGTATSEKGAEGISANFAERGIKGEGMLLDVSDAEQLSAVLKAVADKYGAITVLVNNAGITRDNLLMRMKDEEWNDIMSTNLASIFRASKAVLRGMMKARHGRIINIASVVGVTGNPGQANYAAAKAGVIGFTKSLAREVGSRGITANVIAPGFIRSDMTDVLPEEQKEALKSQIALGDLGSPEDIAAAAVFLASDGARYITGHTLHVNGGMYMG